MVPAAPGLAWQIGLDGLSATDVGLSRPITWHGGFAVLEQGPDTTTALWTSADGRHWASQPLPFTLQGYVQDITPYRNGLALTQFVSSGTENRFEVWTSDDGHAWVHAGGASVDRAEADSHFSASLVPVGTGLALIATIERGMICCGFVSPPDGLLATTSAADASSGARQVAGAGASSFGTPVTDASVGVFAWTSADGATWKRHRLAGFGTDSLSVIGTVHGNLLGLRKEPALRLVRSADAVHWTSVAALPLIVDPDSRLDVASSAGGFIVVADTAANGTRLTIWTGDPRGTWSRILTRQGWQVDSLAVAGQTAILGGDFTGSFVLLSRDGGSTWQAGGGFPDIASLCASWVALAGTTAISVVNCQGGQSPRVLVTEIPAL